MKRRDFLALSTMAGAPAATRPIMAACQDPTIQMPSADTVHVGGSKRIHQHVYNAVQGRNEFEVTGTMKGWDRWADLHKIAVRTLTLGARYDEMDPEDMRKMATLMPKGQAWISETGSHFALYDDQQNYFRAVLTFLKDNAKTTAPSAFKRIVRGLSADPRCPSCLSCWAAS